MEGASSSTPQRNNGRRRLRRVLVRRRAAGVMKVYNAVKEALSCVVCYELRAAPLECEDCGAVVCRLCHADMDRDSCPLCRKASSFARSRIGERICDGCPCPFCEKDECSVFDCKKHYLRCNLCDERVYNADLERHQTYICPRRIIPPMDEDLLDLPELPLRTAVPHNIQFDPDMLEEDRDSPLPIVVEQQQQQQQQQQPTVVESSESSSSESSSEEEQTDPEDTDYQP